MINIEAWRSRTLRLFSSNPELEPWLEDCVSRHQALTPTGRRRSRRSAPGTTSGRSRRGITSVKVSTPATSTTRAYHSNFETAGAGGLGVQAKTRKFVFRASPGSTTACCRTASARADRPCRDREHGRVLAAARTPRPSPGSRLPWKRSATAAAASTGAPSIPTSAIESANGGLLEIERAVNRRFHGAVAGGGRPPTVYPISQCSRTQGSTPARPLRASTPDRPRLKALEEPT